MQFALYDFGVYDAHGQVVTSALHRWRETIKNVPSGFKEPVSNLDGDYIYGGFAANHFGHCLTESLGRLWAVEELRSNGIIFHCSKLKDPTIANFTNLLQIDAPIIIVDRVLSVDRLHVPEQMHSLNARFCGHPDFYKWFRRRLSHVPGSDLEKIYISRRRSPGEIADEQYLEEALSAEGYFILRPEEWSLEQQVSFLKGAKIAIIAEGSAAHFFAMVSEHCRRVGLVRRRATLSKALLTHLRESADREVHAFDAVQYSERLGSNIQRVGLDFRKLWSLFASERLVRGAFPDVLARAPAVASAPDVAAIT